MNGYDMYRDIDQAFAEKDGRAYTDKFVRGLPFGLELSNGLTVNGNTIL
jgi:salicylate hydroxylase